MNTPTPNHMPFGWVWQWPETGLTPAQEVAALRGAIQIAMQVQWSIQDDPNQTAAYIGGTRTMAQVLEREIVRAIAAAATKQAEAA